MIEIIIIIIGTVFVLIWPASIPYIILSYFFILCLGIPALISFMDIHIGSINVYPLDLMYALAFSAFFSYFVKIFAYQGFKQAISSQVKTTVFIIILYLLFFFAKLFEGFIAGIPIDSLVRKYLTDTSIMFFFIPLVIYKDIKQLKKLLKFLVVLALLFPFFQPFLIFSKGTQYILNGQGTFRLGFGEANIFLGFGALALFSWDFKKYLTFLPLAGILMLAHRSGYIAIVLAFLSLSFLKGKKIQNISMLLISAVFVLGLVAALESFTNIDILSKNINRVGETFEYTGTTKARVSAMSNVYDTAEQHPVTGISYAEYNKFTNSRYAADFNVTHPHNFILTTIINGGIIGFILVFTLISRFMYHAYKMIKIDEFKLIGMFLFCATMYFVIYASMNTSMESSGYLFWFLGGCNAWLYNLANNKLKNSA
jgi:O-antigen ligase